MPDARRSHAPRLTREGIVAAAVRLADRDGLGSVSMRRVAAELGVDPMSLYRHVGDKDGLVDAMTDAVVAAIEPVEPTGSWLTDARATALAARATMVRHPWAAEAIRARPSPTPAALRHLDRFADILRTGGFTVDLLHHAIHVLGSRILGFSQDLYDDDPDVRAEPAVAQAQALALAAAYPRLGELALAVGHDGPLGGCDDDAEFAFALDLALEGLARRLADS
jgi:AcrR family transcriptional regulator